MAYFCKAEWRWQCGIRRIESPRDHIPPMAITEADVEAILTHGAALKGAFKWHKLSKYRLKGECVIDDGYESVRMKVSGHFNLRTKGLSYTLRVSTHRIRSLDLRGPRHKNPDGVWVQCPHKHKWTDAYQDRLVYVPTDITANEMREVLIQFLNECNIRFEGTYHDYHEQGSLL